MKVIVQVMLPLLCVLSINNSVVKHKAIELDIIEVFAVTPLYGSGVSYG